MPSGLNATLVDMAGMPLEGEGFLPGPASHTFTVRLLAEASRWPSGLNATLRTPRSCPLSVGFPARSRRPTPSPSHPAGGGEPLAVGAERHAHDTPLCPLRVSGLLPGPGVPHLHRLIPTGGGEPLAVGAERHALDMPGMPLEGELSCPVGASHSFTVRHSLAEASRLPSGLNATRRHARCAP